MTSQKIKLLLLSSFSILFYEKLDAESIENHLLTPHLTDETTPWLTGPLLAPSGHTVPPGHVNIEPYVYFFASAGSYNKNWDYSSSNNFYTLAEQNYIQVGISDFMDFQIVPQMNYKFTQGVRSTKFADLPFNVGFQLVNDSEGTRLPAVKLYFRGSAPLGKYKNLNPEKLGTDSSGNGSWAPGIGLAFSRLYQLKNKHFLAPRFSLNYVAHTPVQVEGINTFGGSLDTKGTIYPGNVFWSDFGLEYTLTRNWVFAMDIFYSHTNKVRFSGKPGFIAPGVPVKMTSPSSESISLAPAIEYNWNINVGLIAGVWFTVKGRNSSQFTSGVIALNMYI